ncbi:hypothetical protein HN51_018486 [Arachis hypogaea]|uniref:uncharacterized protein n=1 Tax=Arachis hypogaea TaxID=3818 RepID=UPI003B2284B1|nr:uncharacterized protein DS421_8g230230 [Arachis hypogaea]
MLRIPDNNNTNRRNNLETTRNRRDDNESSLFGVVPNNTSPPLMNLRPDHVAVGSPLTNRAPFTTTNNNNAAASRFDGGPVGSSPYPAQFRGDHCLWMDTDQASGFHVANTTFGADKWVDDLGGGGNALANNLSRMSIVENGTTKSRSPYDVVEAYSNNNACSIDSNNLPFFDETAPPPFCNAAAGVPVSVTPGFVPKGYAFEASPMAAQHHDHHVYHHHHHIMDQRMMKQATSDNNLHQLQQKPQQQPPPTPAFVNPYVCDRFVGSHQQHFGVECEPPNGWGGGVKNPFRFSQIMHPRLPANAPRDMAAMAVAAAAAAANSGEFPQCISPMRNGGDRAAFRCDNSVIIQGREMVKPCVESTGYGGSVRGFKKGHGQGQVPCDELHHHYHNNNGQGGGGGGGNNNNNTNNNNGGFVRDPSSVPLMLDFYNLAEAQGYVYNMAKDQNGCRFLQRMVEEGTFEDVRVVFEGIVENVVELMMDPFGNYLVQKLLDVCNEDQRLQIVLMLTKEQGQLVRISLNTHGTRVVQKLIETLNSAKQISLVKGAIQPGFLDLIKDLNGNHVIQRCLQCLSCQDNEFIFEAGVKFCVDIATHRHGCCVLQRCIDYSVGKHRERLVAEICKHGLLLAQDPFGNYVVQYIIEIENPTASTKLMSQLKGNFVNLSTQKFSSHVVEKCLKHVADSRSRIVRELLSTPHFEQLLQDPYANYVIQSALAYTKGALHVSLVEAVRPYKILRTSPYCKRIFSGSLLKK